MSTKKLAKQLGFVRKRSQSSAGQKKPLTSNQIFPYLIVIDFESTCWRERNSYGQEIIEFPAVLLNTTTGEMESEFHTYVQPQEHPLLSEFCTELTGITQKQVEAGVPLHICLSRFSRWLQTLELQRGVIFPREQRSLVAAAKQHPCAFVTWSDWDLGVCLLYECKRKQLHKPDVLNSWIDLRATYRLFYNRKPKGLNGALQDLGIKFSGREHSGLDDARNTAHLAWRMMKDGCVMKITRSLERAPLKTKPLFGNGNNRPGNKGDNNINSTANDLTMIKNTEETPKTNCQHLGNPLNNMPAGNTKPQPEHSENKMAAGRADKPKQPLQCQSIVSPKTLLNGLTTRPCGGSSSRTARIGTITYNVSSPVTLNSTSSRHLKRSSLLLVSTTVNIPRPPQPDLNLDPEGGSVAEEVLVLVDSEPCGSYDDVLLEDCRVVAGEDLHTEEEMFEADEAPVVVHTGNDVCVETHPSVFPNPGQSEPVTGPHNSGPSSNTTYGRPSSNTNDTLCQPLTSLNHRLKTRTSSSASVSMTMKTYASAANSSSYAKPRPVSHSDTQSEPKRELPKPKDDSRTSCRISKAEIARTYNSPILKTSTSHNSDSSSFARPRPVHQRSLLSENMRRHRETPNDSFKIYSDQTDSSDAIRTPKAGSKTSTVSISSSSKPVPVKNINHQAECSRPLPSKTTAYAPTAKSSHSLPSPSFTRPRPLSTGRDSNQSASWLRTHTVAQNNAPLKTSVARTVANASSRPRKCASNAAGLGSSVGGSSLCSSSATRSSYPPAVNARITAPLCGCGRRAKRQTVCNGGPNHGRTFYGCAVRKPGPGGNRKSCEFFKWESALLRANSQARTAASSVSLCFGRNISVVHPPTSRKSY
ncbi:ERI1 exoribonuclease 2 [Esox lucius]|uniref:ERI1 exoribonuclease 2 n=1 Tax=Esox lucius TaxID=8010 RepID=A0A6Q2XXS5_ESOLU|nr:ERI1 exoribonuclease 2 [Esox lucius]